MVGSILLEAAHVAASVDFTYEQAMLERFYQVRAAEINERQSELQYWQDRAEAEQLEALDCTEDPDHDLHADSEGWYQELNGILFAGLL